MIMKLAAMRVLLGALCFQPHDRAQLHENLL